MRTKETMFAAILRQRVGRRKQKLTELETQLREVCADTVRYDALRRIVGGAVLSVFR